MFFTTIYNKIVRMYKYYFYTEPIQPEDSYVEILDSIGVKLKIEPHIALN